jgi:hypothetical protein
MVYAQSLNEIHVKEKMKEEKSIAGGGHPCKGVCA